MGDFYYVYDGQGSVIALVEPGGTQRAAYTYDPYGANATEAGISGALPPNPWRWSGSYLDATTGLYKMGARYYDPLLGRFTQVDPVAGGSCNHYDYACGDPINSSDPTGLKSKPREPTDDEKATLARLMKDCSGPDKYGADISGSASCQRFWEAYAEGNLREYGIGPALGGGCPSWFKTGVGVVGLGGVARAAQQFNNANYVEGTATAYTTALAYAASNGLLGVASAPTTAVATYFDLYCSKV